MKLSIVTVARNALADLQTTLAPLLGFTSDEIELVVIDGASTDGTREYLEGQTSKNLRWISERDTGIYNAMNKGVKLAKGEFVYFLNAGDELTDLQALKDAVGLLKQSDIYYCDIFLSGPARTCLRKYPDELTLDFWFLEYMCHQAVFFRRSLFSELGPHREEYRFAADFDFLLHAWKQKKRFEHLDLAIAIYDLCGTSADPKNVKKVFKEYATIQRHRLSPLEYAYGTMLKLTNAQNPKDASLAYRLRMKILRKFLRPLFARRSGFEFDFGTQAKPVPRAPRVLHVNTYAGAGGAAVASLRLHQALLKEGAHSQFVCLSSFSDDPTLLIMNHKGGIARRLQNLIGFFEGNFLRVLNFKRKGLLSPGLTSSLDHKRFNQLIEQFDPDVIHLHWVNHGFLRIKDVAAFKRPVVWTFHDMWAMLGLDHVSLEDSHLRGFEGDDPLYAADRFVWRKKMRSWRPLKGSMKIVCPSQWMRNQAKKSPIWQDADVKVIGNCVPVQNFYPVDKWKAREVLGISPEIDCFLLFGAASPFVEPVKGFEKFVEALEVFLEGKDRSRVLIGTFGDARGKYMVPGVQHKHFGIITNLDFQRAVYSSADVLVVSSAIESFCLVAAEAQACGIPVACFDTAGLKDVVVHEKTGFRSPNGDTKALAAGINWILGDQTRYQSLAVASREHALASFDAQKVAQWHLGIYASISQRLPLNPMAQPVAVTAIGQPREDLGSVRFERQQSL